ncbi:MAG: hypothetical protein GSR80_001004 [Desulfurococcales archaeon]|nr:hypothetical protein [Desulfurococcales archaeon]
MGVDDLEGELRGWLVSYERMAKVLESRLGVRVPHPSYKALLGLLGGKYAREAHAGYGLYCNVAREYDGLVYTARLLLQDRQDSWRASLYYWFYANLTGLVVDLALIEDGASYTLAYRISSQVISGEGLQHIIMEYSVKHGNYRVLEALLSLLNWDSRGGIHKIVNSYKDDPGKLIQELDNLINTR